MASNHRPLNGAKLDEFERILASHKRLTTTETRRLIADIRALRAALIAYMEPAGDTPEELRAQGRAALGLEI